MIESTGLRTFCFLATAWLSLPFTLAVPAPRNVPAQQFPACYDMDWGPHVKQISAFRADGTYHSPATAPGAFNRARMVGRRFSSSSGTHGVNGVGRGASVWWDEDGFTRYGNGVDVRLTRKAMPKGEP